jgi:hypothetical protein
MARPKRFTITPQSDADGVSTSQTPAAGGVQSLTITGALASGGKYNTTTPHLINITCAGNESARTFTVTGKNHAGQPVSESVTGANVGVATTAGYFTEVSGITVDANTAGAVTVGVNGVCSSPWYPVDRRCLDFGIGFAVELSSGAVMTYSVQHTMDDVQSASATISWINHDSVAAETTTQDGNYENPPSAIRTIITSFTSGTAQFNIIPRG